MTPSVSLGPGAATAVSSVRISASATGKGFRLGVIGKRTWSVATGRCRLAPEQTPLVLEPLYDERRGVLVHDSDVMLNRGLTDVIVEGHAYPPEGRTPFDVSVRIGQWSRTARAFGARRVWRQHAGGLRFSEPGAAPRIPLDWESAYGGVDGALRAEVTDPFESLQEMHGQPADPRLGLFAYPRNPVGKGYLIEPSDAALEACELPLLEAPEAILTPDNLVRGDFVCWPEGPPVAGFGWLSYGYFPRSAQLGVAPLVYDGNRLAPSTFFEVRSGVLPAACVRPERPIAERLSAGVVQSAALGMRAPRVMPGDPVLLHGLHARSPEWGFQLPLETPRMAASIGTEPGFELPAARIVSVRLEPDLERLTLVWSAEVELPEPPSPKRLETLRHVIAWQG